MLTTHGWCGVWGAVDGFSEGDSGGEKGGGFCTRTVQGGQHVHYPLAGTTSGVGVCRGATDVGWCGEVEHTVGGALGLGSVHSS